MKKLIAIILSLFLFGNIYCQDKALNDSLRIQKLSEKVEKFENELELLKRENEILQKTNDKILGTVYTTITLIIGSFLGLGIFNSIKSNRLNNQKIENLVDKSKNDLELTMSNKVTELIDSKELKESSNIRNEYSKLKIQVSDLDYSIRNLKENFLIFQIPKHPYNNLYPEIEHIMNLIELQLKTKTIAIEATLEALILELKEDNYIHYDKKNRLMEIVDNELKDKYQHQIHEVKTLLNNKNAR